MDAGYCPRCGGRLATGALSGVCPKCLAAAVASDLQIYPNNVDGDKRPAGQAAALLAAEHPTDRPPDENGAAVSQRDPAKKGSSGSDPFWCDRQPLPKIEGYELVRQVTQGGQGVVYQAVQKSTKRKVAIKVLLDGAFASGPARKRFEREVELVVSLKHPNIIAVSDSGTTADGHPYYVMDYVRGVPITTHVRDRKLEVRRCLSLFATACDAVNHAHQKGVIHRDLKPGNMLVDADGSVRVLDFGLAKAMSEPAAAIPVSVTGHFVGTLHYMSPEQTRGNPDEIDSRTDVYSLGVILYEMLTGCYPYGLDGDVAAVIKRISEAAPAPLSKQWTRESGVSSASSRGQRSGQCPIAADVETIVLKALEKDRERRYESAGELARDIRRYLQDEPILARRASTWYQLRRFVRRNKSLVAAVVGIAAALVGGVVVSSWQSVRANEHRQRAERLASQAQVLETQAKQRLVTGLLLWGDSLAADGDRVGAWNSYMLAWDKASWVGPLATPILAGAVEVTDGDPPLMGTYGRKGGVGGFVGHTKHVNGVALCPDGHTAVTGSADGSLIRWDLRTGLPVHKFEGHSGEVHGPAVSPDGRLMLSGENDGHIILWSLGDGSIVRRLEGHAPDAETVAASPAPPKVGVWTLAFSPDGRTALSGSDDHTMKLWDIETGQCLRTFRHRDSVGTVLFLPDGKRALSACHDHTMRLWDLSNPDEPLRSFEGHEDAVNSVALLPGAERAVSGSFDGRIGFWDLSKTEPEALVPAHGGWVWRVAVSADGRTLVSGGADGTVRLWDVASRRQIESLPGQVGGALGVAISADGRTVVASGDSGSYLRVWATDRTAAGTLRMVNETPTCIAVSGPAAVGRRVACGTADGQLLVLDAQTRAELHRFGGHRDAVRAAYLAADGRNAISIGGDGTVLHWDVSSGGRRKPVRADVGQVTCAGVTPDGRLAVSMSAEHPERLAVWSLETGEMIRTIRWPAEPVTSLAVSADGRTALAGFASGTVRLWDFQSPDGAEIRSFSAHAGAVSGVSFCPTVGLFCTAGNDKLVKLWDVDAKVPARTFRGLGAEATAIAFSADGLCVGSAARDGTLRVWDLDRVSQLRAFELAVPKARLALSRNRDDAEALEVLGRWYAFRRLNSWADDFGRLARGSGAKADRQDPQ
jgi:WD40 repeat protein/serine/threonine protein kinase